MEILVDDGSGSDDGCGMDDDTTEIGTVEAGTLGTVVATHTLYDTKLSDANGCDPAGCTASLTRVRFRERHAVTEAAAVNYVFTTYRRMVLDMRSRLQTYICKYMRPSKYASCRWSPSKFQEMPTNF